MIWCLAVQDPRCLRRVRWCVKTAILLSKVIPVNIGNE